MQYFIAVFRSRTECYAFLNILRSYTQSVKIINTPKEVNMPCGVSVAFSENVLNIAKQLLYRRNFNSFVGFYKVIQTRASLSVLPLGF